MPETLYGHVRFAGARSVVHQRLCVRLLGPKRFIGIRIAIYFTSDRDGFTCIWAQRLKEDRRHRAGEPFAVRHFHEARISPGHVHDAVLKINVAEDRLILNLGEVTGTVWMAREPR